MFFWANDPTVRSNAFSGQPISYRTHLRWLAGQLGRPESAIFIFQKDGADVGMVRFQQADDDTISLAVSVAREHRGKGLAAALIADGSTAYRALNPGATIRAQVKTENHASRRAFERAGFRVERAESGQPFVSFRLP